MAGVDLGGKIGSLKTMMQTFNEIELFDNSFFRSDKTKRWRSRSTDSEKSRNSEEKESGNRRNRKSRKKKKTKREESFPKKRKRSICDEVIYDYVLCLI